MWYQTSDEPLGEPMLNKMSDAKVSEGHCVL